MYPTVLRILKYFTTILMNCIIGLQELVFLSGVFFNVYLVDSYRSFGISAYLLVCIFLGMEVILKFKLIYFSHKLSFLPLTELFLGIQVGTLFSNQNLKTNHRSSLF